MGNFKLGNEVRKIKYLLCVTSVVFKKKTKQQQQQQQQQYIESPTPRIKFEPSVFNTPVAYPNHWAYGRLLASHAVLLGSYVTRVLLTARVAKASCVLRFFLCSNPRDMTNINLSHEGLSLRNVTFHLFSFFFVGFSRTPGCTWLPWSRRQKGMY